MNEYVIRWFRFRFKQYFRLLSTYIIVVVWDVVYFTFQVVDG